jgi:hypothetical protein
VRVSGGDDTSRTGVSAKFRYGSNYPLTGYITTDPDAPTIDGQPAFYAIGDARGTPRGCRHTRADRAFNWSRRRLVLFVEVANILNRDNRRNTPRPRRRRDGVADRALGRLCRRVLKLTRGSLTTPRQWVYT